MRRGESKTSPRVPAELVAERAGEPLTTPILLPGVAGAVVAVAVELDRQPVLGPAAVDPLPAGRAVGHRKRQSGAPEAFEEARLEPAERHVDVAVMTPATRRSVGVLTSGGGAAPLRITTRWPAARPHRCDHPPHARTAAR